MYPGQWAVTGREVTVQPNLAPPPGTWDIGSKGNQTSARRQFPFCPKVQSLGPYKGPLRKMHTYLSSSLLDLTATLWYPKWGQKQEESPASGFPENNGEANWSCHSTALLRILPPKTWVRVGRIKCYSHHQRSCMLSVKCSYRIKFQFEEAKVVLNTHTHTLTYLFIGRNPSAWITPQLQ